MDTKQIRLISYKDSQRCDWSYDESRSFKRNIGEALAATFHTTTPTVDQALAGTIHTTTPAV
jgi:hypothetical protein